MLSRTGISALGGTGTILGIIVNISSFLVLVRNRDGIPVSRVLLGLTVADTGVLVSVFALSFRVYWWGTSLASAFTANRYFYFCSIYITVLLSLDRYVVTSRPLLVRRINHKKLQWRLVASVFVVAIPLVVPQFLSYTLYFDGCTHHTIFEREPHNETQAGKFLEVLCNKSVQCELDTNNDTWWETLRLSGNLSSPEATSCDELEPLRRFYCEGDQTTFDGKKFTRRKEFEMCYVYLVTYLRNDTTIEIKHVLFHLPLLWNPRFKYGYTVLVVLFLRYILPTSILFYVNIRLVQIVRAARHQHSALVNRELQEEGTHAQNTGILKMVIVVVGIFLLLHLLALAEDMWFLIGVSIAGPNYHSSFLNNFGTLTAILVTACLSGVNSTVNVGIYCFFLPQFRKKWLALWPCRKIRRMVSRPDGNGMVRDDIHAIEEIRSDRQGVPSSQQPQQIELIRVTPLVQ